MSHTKLKSHYIDSLRQFTGCPFCGAEMTEGAGCCGEVRQETLFDDGDEIFTQAELPLRFEKWLSAQPELFDAKREPDPMTLAKNWREDNE